MRILVLSDSHGNMAAVCRAIDAQPTAGEILFLGDGLSDLRRAAERYTDRRFHAVRGNCDACGSDAPVFQVITCGGQRLYLTHGYAERVKMSLLTLSYTAREQGAQAALYGHTHTALITYDNGLLLFNPGSIGGSDGSYGTLDILPGGVIPSIFRLHG